MAGLIVATLGAPPALLLAITCWCLTLSLLPLTAPALRSLGARPD